MPATIRTATIADLPHIVELDVEGFKESFPYSTLRQYLDIAGEFAMVAEEDGKVVGYVLGCRGSTPDVGWLLSAAVTANYRIKGLGGQLGDELVRRLEAAGMSKLLLSVRHNNTPMLKWCSHSGFEQIADDPAYFGPGERRLVMCRQKR